MSEPQSHIIIVGAGLVGATLAALLANDPVNKTTKITVIDQSAAPRLPDISTDSVHYDPRVVALTLASEKILNSIGAWQLLTNLRSCPYENMKVWDDEGTGSIEFNAVDIEQNHLGTIVENGIALHAILDTLVHYPQVKILREQAIKSFEETPHSITLTLENGESLQGDLLVAADGGSSKVRTLANFSVKETSYAQQAIVATVKTEEKHQHTAWQNFLSSGPLALLPLAGAKQHYSSIVWSLDDALVDSIMQLTDEEFGTKVSRALNGRLGDVELISQRYCFPLIERSTNDYFKGRVVLAGDAAHTIHPLAGQGVNLGLLDAQSLAQEIMRAQTRQLRLSDPSVLSRYQRQRKHHTIEMMMLMKGFKNLFGQRSLALRLLRNQGLTTINNIKPVKNWLAKQASGI